MTGWTKWSEKLAAFVGFDAEHKRLAGCFVSIGQDGTPFLDKGLVKPEHRKQLAKLLKADGGDGEPATAKPKNQLPETLRRDLAAYRLQVAQVEIARHPAIALDLLAFQVASQMLDAAACLRRAGHAVQAPRRAKPASQQEPTAAAQALDAIEKSLPAGWRKPKSEAARFEAFRYLPEASQAGTAGLLRGIDAATEAAPADGDEATAYDTALALTEANVAGYWRRPRTAFSAASPATSCWPSAATRSAKPGRSRAPTTRKRRWSSSSTGPSPTRTSPAGRRTRSRS